MNLKLIKAFVEPRRVEPILRLLRTAGAGRIVVSTDHGIGFGPELEPFTLGPKPVSQTAIAKIEILTETDELDRLIETLCEGARNGTWSDGVVLVTSVERLIRIRNGADCPDTNDNQGEGES